MAEQKIRVLQLIDGLSFGGAERIVFTLSTRMDKGRFQVIPCALRRSGPLEEEMKGCGVTYSVLGIRRRSVFTGPLFLADLCRTISQLSETLKRLSVDIVHTHLTESTLVGILAARRAGVPRVCVTIHNTIIYPQRGQLSLRYWLMRVAINRVFSQANRVIAVSEEVAQAVRSDTRIPLERILTIPNGIDADRFRFKEDRQSLRRTVGLPLNKQIVVTVGRLTRQKGYPHLLTALTLIPPECRPLTLLVGDGPDRKELESRTIALGIADDVRFLGNRHDVPVLLAASDVFVLPSLWEGLPLALLEAMASRLPVVVTNVGANPDVIENGVSGILVPAADEQKLAGALTNLLRDHLGRQFMGRSAFERFENRFSLQSFVKAHECLYEKMLLGNPG